MAVKRSNRANVNTDESQHGQVMWLFIITSWCVFECKLYFDTVHSVMCTHCSLCSSKSAEIFSINNQLCGGVCNSIIKNSLMKLLRLITFQWNEMKSEYNISIYCENTVLDSCNIYSVCSLCTCLQDFPRSCQSRGCRSGCTVSKSGLRYWQDRCPRALTFFSPTRY